MYLNTYEPVFIKSHWHTCKFMKLMSMISICIQIIINIQTRHLKNYQYYNYQKNT